MTRGLYYKVLVSLCALVLLAGFSTMFVRTLPKVPRLVKVEHQVSGYATITVNVNADIKTKGIPESLVIHIPPVKFSWPADYSGILGGEVTVHER